MGGPEMADKTVRLSLEAEPWVVTMLYIIVVLVSTDGENTSFLFKANLGILFLLDSFVILNLHEYIHKLKLTKQPFLLIT